MLQPRTWLEGTDTSVTGVGWRVSIEPMEWLTLEFLCFNMRAIDRQEISNMLPSDNPLEWAATIHHACGRDGKGVGWVARINGRPAATMGVFENFPGCWQLFSFGTDQYVRVLALFKPKLDLMWAFAREHGGHRVECKTHAQHITAHALCRIVGFTHEATFRNYGTDGADYLQFARVWPKVPRAVGDESARQVETGAAGVRDATPDTVLQ